MIIVLKLKSPYFQMRIDQVLPVVTIIELFTWSRDQYSCDRMDLFFAQGVMKRLSSPLMLSSKLKKNYLKKKTKEI